MKKRYLTITYRVVYQNPDCAPVMVENLLRTTPDGETFFHPEGGPTHFYLKKDKYKIVKDHGHLDPQDDDDWETIKKLIVENYQLFHLPETELRVGAGWLSPAGTFYPCESWAHDSKAEVICRAVLGNLEGTQYLEKGGWLRIYVEGLVARGRGRNDLTQKQIDALWDLYQKSDGTYKKQIGSSIGIYGPIVALKKPVRNQR